MRNTLPGYESSETKQLMLWIKGLVTSPRCNSLQDLADGVVWCRLMGKLRPGALASVLIIHRPANAKDSLHNYMLLESAFGQLNMLWSFETSKLIASEQSELLKLAKCFALLRDTPTTQLQLPKKKITSRSMRQPRCPAGELLHPQYSNSGHTPSTGVFLDAVQPVQLAGEQQLKPQIQTMVPDQEVAVDTFMVDEQQSQNSSTPPNATMLCFCSKCLSQSLDTAAEL